MKRKLQYAILGADLLWIGGTFTVADLLSNRSIIGRPGSAVTPFHFSAVLVALSVWIVLYFSKKLEGFCRGWHLPSVFAQVTVGVCYLMGAVFVLALCGKHDRSTAELLCVGGLLPLGFIAVRCSAWGFLTLRADRPANPGVLFFRPGPTTRGMAHKIT